MVCEGGLDCILDLKSGNYMKTQIKDTGKDYIIEMYVERKDDLDITQPRPHGNDKPIIGYKPKSVNFPEQMLVDNRQHGLLKKTTLAGYMPIECRNRFAPFTRQP